MPVDEPSRVQADAPGRLCLCLHPSHLGEFYYPLADGEKPGCPYDGTHPVRVYRAEDANAR